MHKLHRKFLLKSGWLLDKEYPLHITHENGSIASGTAAETIIRTLNFPEVIVQWYHPEMEITCEELLLEQNIPGSFEHVWDQAEGKPHGEQMSFRPYFDKVRVGDYWIVNGHWWGRREKYGFRVLATHNLAKCDHSLWERRERLGYVYDPNDDEDCIAF